LIHSSMGYLSLIFDWRHSERCDRRRPCRYQVQLPQWSWFSSSGIVIGLEGSVDGTSLSNTAAAFFPDGTTVMPSREPTSRVRFAAAWVSPGIAR